MAAPRGSAGAPPAGGLHLVVPGLLGPVPIAPDQVPPAPILERLIARGSPLPATGNLEQVLFAAFGLALDPAEDPPSAPFCRLADDPGGDQDGYWLHADPVHLRLDRDRLLLYDARHLDLTREESQALVALFNSHFASDGLTLEAPVPDRWYLRLGQPPRLRTQPLDAVAGRDIAPFLPQGEDARRWAALLNETQMLFSRAEVNQRREAEGRLPISGIWPWGGGTLAALQPRPSFPRIFADHPLAAGLARHTGAVLQPLAEVERGLGEAASQGAVLVVWDRLWPEVLDVDPVAWAAQLVRLEGWLGKVQGQLRTADLDRWNLDGCEAGRWRIARRDAWRLWRRVRPLAAFLASAGHRGQR